MRLGYLPSFFLLAATALAQSGQKSVFAHFIVGNAAAMTDEQWISDITEARKAHIDGFALNIAPQDSYTDQVLQKAYTAAETVGNFSLFLSFDYQSGGPWPVDRVIATINTYKNRPAQFHFEGQPLVSTFEGTGNAGDWPNIKTATGCVFIPSWTSLGPTGIAAVLSGIDGMFSWDAWPVGAEDKDTTSDLAWMNALAGKPYMMPVAPWFYTNLPQWGKNWLWRGDDLWHMRWQQVIELQPALVQIISWNDYGETHYIGPLYEKGIPEGASRYVSNHPHDAWRTLLPHYIDAYKAGNGTDFNGTSGTHTPAVHKAKQFFNSSSTPEEKITFWYRLNPSGSGSFNGTTGNNPAMGQDEVSPTLISQDRVFVTVLVAEPSTVFVQIGDAKPTALRACTAGINHFSIPFDGRTGEVKFAVVRNGQQIVTAAGPAITDQCPEGNVDWNAVVGASDIVANNTSAS